MITTLCMPFIKLP